MKKSSATAPRRAASHPLVVGIDTGGTFTDLVALVDGDIHVHKVLSTPGDPAEAVIAGLKALLENMAPTAVTYSSTVATNALLEKKGARVALSPTEASRTSSKSGVKTDPSFGRLRRAVRSRWFRA